MSAAEIVAQLLGWWFVFLSALGVYGFAGAIVLDLREWRREKRGDQ